MTHNFVTSYSYALPFDRMFRSSNAFTTGWALAGTTRFSTGFPVDLEDDSDRSLLGTLGNGVNNHLLDTPQLLPGPLKINTDPRKNPYGFNTGLFAPETLGQLAAGRRKGLPDIGAQALAKGAFQHGAPPGVGGGERNGQARIGEDPPPAGDGLDVRLDLFQDGAVERNQVIGLSRTEHALGPLAEAALDRLFDFEEQAHG